MNAADLSVTVAEEFVYSRINLFHSTVLSTYKNVFLDHVLQHITAGNQTSISGL